MKLKQLLKDIDGVFKPPKKRYYFGKIYYGCPYFYPPSFLSSIIKIRRLIPRTEEQIQEYCKRYSWRINQLGNDGKYSNFPMVTRNKAWIKKIFGNEYYIQIGYPFSIYRNELGWKDKWYTPRYEWSPAFFIFFFKWQFCMWWNAPDGDNDLYYEMILWYRNYSNKDINKAKETWSWINYETKESTWNDNYLI